jgi:hypothetical protein
MTMSAPRLALGCSRQQAGSPVRAHRFQGPRVPRTGCPDWFLTDVGDSVIADMALTYRLNELRWVFLLVILFSAVTARGQAAGSAPAPSLTTTCRFLSGPRAGQTQDFTGLTAATPMSIGNSCSDGESSRGIAIASAAAGDDTTARASEVATLPTGMTLTCRFYTGPRTGQIQDLAASPARIGSLCSDGGSSAGIAIAPTTSSTGTNFPDHSAQTNGVGPGRTGSTICQFMSGPKAHGWHDYAPVPPLALGKSCQDGANSVGIIVVAGHGQQY